MLFRELDEARRQMPHLRRQMPRQGELLRFVHAKEDLDEGQKLGLAHALLVVADSAHRQPRFARQAVLGQAAAFAGRANEPAPVRLWLLAQK